MLVVSIPIFLVGFMYRAYGVPADVIHGDAGPDAKYDNRLMAKIGRASYIIFALGCAAYILMIM